MSEGGGRGRTAMVMTGMDAPYEADACYQTFCTHWQQALKAMRIPSAREVRQDAVLCVVNHVDQMGKLLLLEAARHAGSEPPPCYTHLIHQQSLHKLEQWGSCAGRYSSAMMSELLRLLVCLLQAQGPLALREETVVEPLVRMLTSCAHTLQPVQVQDLAVSVVEEICLVVSQDVSLLDQLFVPPDDQCVVVGVVVSALHGEGWGGARARQALLLLVRAARRHARLARSLAPPRGTALVALATGLSGLFSLLPRSGASGRARLLADDVRAAPRLGVFLDCAEACDAAARVGPAGLRSTLLELVYQGFLVPVLGPALLQGGAEAASAVQYTELLVRCVTPRGALRPLLRFLLTHEYDGARLLHCLVDHLATDTPTSLCVLALLDTLLELNCEDVMLQLTLGCLPPAPTFDSDEYWQAADTLLSLVPRAAVLSEEMMDDDSLMGHYPAYLSEARLEMSARAAACGAWSERASSPEPGSSGHSSGYDSFPTPPDDAVEAERSFWTEACPAACGARGGGGAGCGRGEPLLPALLRAARGLLSADLPRAALLTGVLSKLAAFPLPSLARAILTDVHPDTSIHHVLSELKREADCVGSAELVSRARSFLREREAAVATPPPPLVPHPAPRRSLTATLSNMFTRRAPPLPVTQPEEDRSWSHEAWWGRSRARRVTLNALVVGEWCRELAARAAHHALAAAAPAPSRAL